MSSVGACDNCCSSTENEPLCLCDGCEQESQLANDAAKEAAHAAGYAAAVADIRQLVLAAANRQSGEMFRAKGAVLRRIYGTVSESLFGLLEAIAAGAHVGAAKKGAT